MARHLHLAVLVVQVAYTLQAPISSTSSSSSSSRQSLIDLLTMSQMANFGQDGRNSFPGQMQDDIESDINNDLREYINRYPFDAGDFQSMAGFLEEFNENSDRMVNHYRVEQSEDMITRTILYDLFTNFEGPSDFAKSYLLQRATYDMEHLDGNRQLVSMLMRQLMMNPRSENSHMAMRLLYHLLSMLDEEGKEMMRMNILNMMNMYRSDHDALELLMNLMHFMMNDDVAYNMDSRQSLLLLLQHFMSMQYHDSDKRAMSMLLLRDLSEREDYQGEGILRNFVASMILSKYQASDVPSSEQWKFYPPGPCLVEDRFGNNINSSSCPHDLSCNIGPVTYTFNARSQRYTMCAYPLDNFLFHACEVTHPDGRLERRPSCRTDTSCNFGPFTITSGGNQYRARFCSDVANNTVSYNRTYPVSGKACAIEDEYGLRSVQRRCPEGQTCDGGRFPVMNYDNRDSRNREYALMCQPHGGSSNNRHNNNQNTERNFMDSMMYSMMGLGDDLTNLGMANLRFNDPRMRDIASVLQRSLVQSNNMGMGGNMAGHMGNNNNNQMDDDRANNRSDNFAMNEEFMNFVIAFALQEQQEDRREMNQDSSYYYTMFDEEYDPKLYRIMRYVVQRFASDQPMLVETVKLMMDKYQLGVLRNEDRLVMHGIIRYLLGMWYSYQQVDGQSGGFNSDDFLSFMRYNMDYDSRYGSGNMNMNDLWRMIYDQETEMRRQHQGNDFLNLMRNAQQRGDSFFDMMDHYNYNNYNNYNNNMGQNYFQSMNQFFQQQQQQQQGYDWDSVMRHFQKMDHEYKHREMINPYSDYNRRN